MKIDIEALRKAVNRKLISEQMLGFDSPVEIHHGSHSSFEGIPEDSVPPEINDADSVKQNLFQLSVYAAKLHDLLEEGIELEPDMERNITRVTNKISDIYHKLEYQSYKNSK
jgi:hypothetical protein